ncbi:uncharacterized protein C16orf78 homolog isoform X2 [Pseudophryne corroboree]|uniref:uncharacterized protein C16orf78 homolog isoform X2 n=1 Tax=Pseudophryne corroboree TaxID=495146 RepID=UPI0030815DC1
MSNDKTKVGSAIIGCIDNNRARTLMVSNDRESFQLKKLNRSIETMKSVNDNLRKHEQRKVQRNLAKLTDVSTSGANSSIYQPSNCDRTEPEASTGRSAIPHSDHLFSFASFLKQPFRQLNSTEKKKSKAYVPFSGGGPSSMGLNTTKPQNDLGLASWSKSSSLHRGASPSQCLCQQSRSIYVADSTAMLSSQHILCGRKYPRASASGNPAFERRLQELLLKDCQEGKCKSTSDLPHMQPHDALRCRYLRLTESNISTLLQKCEDSGMHIDIHPHMKESDIGINSLMPSEDINAVSL